MKNLLSVLILTTIIPLAHGYETVVEACSADLSEEESEACHARQQASIEKQRRYHSYSSPGFCVPYTGRECLDYGYGYGTIAIHSKIGNGGAYCKVRQYLTARGRVRQELVEGFNCIYE